MKRVTITLTNEQYQILTKEEPAEVVVKRAALDAVFWARRAQRAEDEGRAAQRAKGITASSLRARGLLLDRPRDTETA